jgi:predicted transcriptional regulator
MKKERKKLTKAEEEIMQLFWKHGPSTVSQLIQKMKEPKPAQTTVSSFVRILEKKGFVDHKAYGRTYEYFPVITQEDYSKFSLKSLVSNYFGGSMKELVSFIAKEEDLSLNDISELIEESKNNKK